jgi:hypothetical protein
MLFTNIATFVLLLVLLTVVPLLPGMIMTRVLAAAGRRDQTIGGRRTR